MKKLMVLLITAMLCTVSVGVAYASPPEDVEVEMAIESLAIEGPRFADNNAFYTLTNRATFSGDIVGVGILVNPVLGHNWGGVKPGPEFTDQHGVMTIEMQEVKGHSGEGEVVLRFDGKIWVDRVDTVPVVAWDCRWRIIGGTGDWGNLHGQGKVSGTAGWGPVTLTGQIHFGSS